jgi:hypothetical protein
LKIALQKFSPSYDMHTLSIGLIVDSKHTVLIAVCLLSVGFLFWFLVALALDERKMRRQQLLFLGAKSSMSDQMVPTRSLRYPQNKSATQRAALSAITGRPTRDFGEKVAQTTLSKAELHVLRLSHKKKERMVTLRWRIMIALLSATFQRAGAQSTPPSGPLPAPAITGPLQGNSPINIDGGPLGKLDLDGVVSGMGLWQGNHVAGDDSTQTDLSNGQLFIQKTTGWWQFYVQAGAYNIFALGTPYLSTDKAVTDLYGPVPVAFVKLVPGKNTSIQIGALPTLMGAEYTFDFENMNIERGLLWNQENAVNRGIQVNQTLSKFTASISWNDGYYSNRYSWLSGSLTYTKGPHSLEFVAMGNLGQTARQTLATPVQNNGSMYALIYTYTKGNWIIQPYYQHGGVPTNPKAGVLHGASTDGIAALVSRTFKHGFSLTGRGEYIGSTGSTAQNSVNLIYGPGSGAWSLTLTPTYQYQRFFIRGDFSFVRATDFTPGDAFGSTGTNPNQPRGVIEMGFLF